MKEKLEHGIKKMLKRLRLRKCGSEEEE